VTLLKNNGVTIIELGVQSMIQDVLNRSRRGHRVEDVYNAVKTIRDKNMTLGLQMMIGLPGDTPYNSAYTASKIASLKPDFVRIYPTLVIKNTELEHMLYQNQYQPLSVETAVEYTLTALSIFEANKIKVIRVGLQASEGIRLGVDVIAGPFHEAFRELVEGRIAYISILNFLQHRFDDTQCNRVTLVANDRYVSCLVGHKKENIKKIKDMFKELDLTVSTSMDINYGDILAIVDKVSTVLPRDHAMKQIYADSIELLQKNHLKGI
jgi:histone acetyltransferase (RNA polymerase elongator complex component)